MQIIFEKENTQLQNYNFNFEELKSELNQNLEKFRNLVVTEYAIQAAKTSRADLNKLKKEITSKVSEIKREHLKPFDAFKKETDELIRLIDEPVNAIDSQVKTYEQKIKDEKLSEIILIWEKEKPCEPVISFDQIFNEKWLNAGITLKKVKEDIVKLVTRIVTDIQVIEAYNSEFEIALKEVYLKDFDISLTMREKARYEQRKLDDAARQEQLRINKEENERKQILLKKQKEEEVIIKFPDEEQTKKELIFEFENEIKDDLETIEELELRIISLKKDIDKNKQRIKVIKEEIRTVVIIGDEELPF